MTPPTIWPARRVGDRILCGRRVAGRYVCQGQLASASTSAAGPRQVAFPSGFVEDPPGFMRLVPGVARRTEEGRLPNLGRKAILRPVPARGKPSDLAKGSPEAFGRKAIRVRIVPTLPVRAKCPHCRTLAIVGAGLLDSIPTE
jgi:hypothetical protein